MDAACSGRVESAAHVPEDPAETPPAPPRAEFDLGVLFVHGIGDQARGSTLVAFGEPLWRWLDRRFLGITRSWGAAGLDSDEFMAWRARHGETLARDMTLTEWGPNAETLTRLSGATSTSPAAVPLESLPNDLAGDVLAARLHCRDAHVRSSDDGAPSHAAIQLHAVTTQAQTHVSNWLVAESWWADTLTEPGASELAQWLIAVVPYALGSHFGVRVRRALAKLPGTSGHRRFAVYARVLFDTLALIASLPLAVALQVLIAIVVLVGLLPVPRIGGLLVAVERLLARTIGDSLVLISSPIQRAAMVSQVRRDAAWLSARCATVAVVAHSQGGAIAHQALRSQRPQNLRLLFTFGSGLRKLETIEETANTEPGLYGHAYLTGWAVVFVGYAAWSAVVWHAWAPWALFGGGGLFGFLIWQHVSAVQHFDSDWFNTQFASQGLWWIDTYASADPVSNGPLTNTPDPSRLSVEVCNERSMLTDHTSYWANTEGFVPTVARALTYLVPGPWHRLVTLAPESSATGLARRSCRVGALVAMRWSSIMTIVALAIVRRDDWWQVTRWLVMQAGEGLAWLGPGPWSVTAVERPPVAVWSATAGATVALLVVRLAARWWWNRWNQQEERLYFTLRPRVAPGTPLSGYGPLGAHVEIFGAMWLFASAIVGQWFVALAFVPDAVRPWTFEMKESAEWSSGLGLGLTLMLLGLQRRAIHARIARATQPVPAS